MNMKWKLLLGSVLIVAIWEIAPRVLNRQPPQPATPTVKSETDQIFAVVQSYVEAADRRDSKNLSTLTTEVPKGARTTSPFLEPTATDVKNPSQDVAVVTSTEIWNRTALNEIRTRFPETLANGQPKIHSVQKLLVKDGLAKVTVTFESEIFNYNLPWVFMLAKNPEGQWKIYDINSQYNAVEYLPDEIRQP